MLSATALALSRHLTGHTPELREQRYAKILAANPEEVKGALLKLLEPGFARRAVCVVSSRQKLEEANRQMPDAPLAIEDILT